MDSKRLILFVINFSDFLSFYRFLFSSLFFIMQIWSDQRKLNTNMCRITYVSECMYQQFYRVYIHWIALAGYLYQVEFPNA